MVCTLATVLTVGSLPLVAQPASQSQSGFIPVIVTDPHNRFVNGLQEENCVILENGFRRPVTYFSDADSPIALAIISESPLPMRDMLKPEDEVIQTSTVSDALRQLITSRNPRKVIIVTTNADIESVPSIQVVHSGPAEVFKVVIELRNQYLLRFRSSDPSARVELTLKQPSGLPLLKPIWKAPF
jgi:hypothetical protein